MMNSCINCGKPFDGEGWYCHVCQEAEDRKNEAAFQREVPQIIAEAGIPDGYRYRRDTGKPVVEDGAIVPHAAAWVWEHRNSNLLISGATGAGKSTSICWAAMKLIAAHCRVRYVKLQRLLCEWTEARMLMSENVYSEQEFFGRFQKLDYLLIDEAVGKTKDSDSRREMMFELLDEIANGELKLKLWLAGNFRKNSIDALFGEENREPSRRRIEENFICAGITENEVEIFHVWP